MTINHSKVSTVVDVSDTDLVRPSDWNYQLVGTLDLTNTTNSTTDVRVSGALPATVGGTAQSTYATGDILAASATNTLSKVSGNVTTSQLFLSSIGDGTNATLPSWQPAPVLGVLIYYWTNTASDIVSYYKELTSPFATLNTISNAGVTNGQLLATFATEPNNPNRTFLPDGEYSCHIHAAKTAGTKDVYVRAEVWEVTAAGVDVARIATLGNSVALTGVNAEYLIAAATVQYDMALSTSRVVTKVYATVTGGGSAPTVVLYMGGVSDSRTSLPAPTVDITNYVPYTGATTAVNLNSQNLTTTGTISTAAATITNMTEGSVLFAGAAGVVSQDNTNLYWNNTINRLGIGVNTFLVDTEAGLHIIGDIELEHTATAVDDHAMEMDVDAAGFGDVKALDITYRTGAIAAGQDEAVMLVSIDESLATGGTVSALEVLTTEGSTTVDGMFCGALVNPIRQLSGTFANANSILVLAVNQLTALSSGGAGNVSIFVADNDTMTIGSAAKFEEIEFLLDIFASGAGIAPTFEFSTAIATWSTFTPVDGTNGMRQSGVIAWEDADISTWAVGAGAEYLIRITRTRNTLVTTPRADKVQISATTTFYWDKLGDLSIRNAAFTGNITGNPGLASATATTQSLGDNSTKVATTAYADAVVPTTVSTANEASDTTCFPLFVTASGTQSLQPKNNTSLTFNSSTGAFGATSAGFGSSPDTTILLNTGGSVAGTTGNITGLAISTALGASAGTVSAARHLYIDPVHSNNASTISNAYGCYIDGGGTAGTITNGFSLRVVKAAYGTNKYTASFDVGVGFGGTPASGTVFTVGGDVRGTASNFGMYLASTLGTTSGTATNAAEAYISPTFSSNVGTITSAYGIWIDAGTTAGTITTGYGMKIDALAYGTTRYGLHVSKPSGGTNNYTAYFDGIVGIGITPTLNVSLYIGGSLTHTDSVYGIFNTTNIGATSGTITEAANTYVSPNFSANAGTITTAYALRVVGGSTAGTITTGFGLHVTKPTYGTNKYTAYFDQIVGIGVTPAANISLYISGSLTGTTGNIYGFLNQTNIGASSGTIAAAVNTYIDPQFSANVGTITTAYGCLIAGGTTAGTITNGYGLSVTRPTYGTNKYTAYFDTIVGIGTSPLADRVLAIAGSVAQAANNYGFVISATMGSTSGTVTESACMYVYPSYSGNTATTTSAFGLYVLAGATAGTITNGWSLYVQRPAYGTNKYTAYFDNGVGIAIANTGATHALLVTGTAGLSTGTLWTNTSDVRIKTNIRNTEEALPIINALQPRKFEYTNSYRTAHKLEDKDYYGFVADEVEEVLPSCVRVGHEGLDDNNNLKQLDLHNVNILLVQAVKELSAKVKSLESKRNRS